MFLLVFLHILVIIEALTVTSSKALDTSRYLDLEEIDDFLRKLQNSSQDVMKLECIGTTFMEGKKIVNDINLVTIGDPEAPILFFDCGIHAREWISPAVCLQMIENLVNLFKGKLESNSLKDLLDYQWQFIPVLNPDGYQRSHLKDKEGEDLLRMQRKNLRPQATMNLTEDQETRCDDEGDCTGVDLNRNFPIGWGEGHAEFVEESQEPWSNVYKGSHPLSEPESMAIHQYLKENVKNILLAVTVHSYGKDIYFPKGYLVQGHPDQIKGKQRKYVVEFAEGFNKALGYRIGTVGDLLPVTDLSGGAIDDYYFGYWGINLSYTLELEPDIKKHRIGFKLPANKIKSVGEKVWKALQIIAKKMNSLRDD